MQGWRTMLLLHKYKLALASALGIRFLSFLSAFWGTTLHSSSLQVLQLFICARRVSVVCACSYI